MKIKIITFFIVFGLFSSLALLIVPDISTAFACTDNSECPNLPGTNVCDHGEVRNWYYSQICLPLLGICSPTGIQVDYGYHPCALLANCCPVRCSNPDGAEGDWRYDCSLATAGGCTVAEGCVGLPQQCRSGTWVTTNPSGECTTDCTNCSHATPTPTPAPTPTPTPPPGVCENNCGGLGVCGFRKPDNSCTTDNSCCHRVCNASRVCVTEAGGGNNACDNNAGCVGPTPTPTPTPVPGCDTSALTIIPNPARVGDRMLFRYPPAQDQNLGTDTWNPSTSVRCYRDVLANRQYICTAAQATSPTGTWTHKWNFGNCSKTATYTINPGYTPWIQVTGDVHSNVRIYAPGGP